MKPPANKPCPCHSGRKYKSCCGPIIGGATADSPVALMRSRYTAYATSNTRYIVKTTHTHGPHARPDIAKWEAEIHEFCTAYRFTGLTIHSHHHDESTGRVHFTATLTASHDQTELIEHSLFYRVDNQWLYWGRVSESESAHV